MKIIKYKMGESQIEVGMTWSEANEVIANGEAYGGEYTVEEDDRPEPGESITSEERIAQLEAALELLLSGVTE
jgi:hypothetical protein